METRGWRHGGLATIGHWPVHDADLLLIAVSIVLVKHMDEF